MKIAYYLPSVGVSGGVAVVCQHANRLQQRGHDVFILTNSEYRKIDWFPNQKVPVISRAEFPEDIDILVATGWETSFEIVGLPAKHKCYFVQSDESRFHPTGSEWQGITALSYLMNFNYLTEARWIQRWLMDNFGHPAALVPNGLDETLFFPSEPLTPKGKKPRILLEGAIAFAYKGMEEAFTAVSDLDAEIWCVSTLGVPKPTWRCDRFFKQVPLTEMRKIYSSCDILLKLSRVEGLFGPPMEMMACGGTVVVGKVSGYDEYIVDGENALVVDPQDIPAARAAVEKLISDENLRKKLIANGLVTAKNWNWEPSIDHLEAFYQKIFADGGRPVSAIRQVTDQSIAAYFSLLRNTHQYDRSQEPFERLFYVLNKQAWIRNAFRMLFHAYKSILELWRKISMFILFKVKRK
jgi:O-antigen biosynthesis protein